MPRLPAFDTFCYPVLGETQGRPFGFWVHGNDDDDTAGAIRRTGQAALSAVHELASTVAVTLLE